MPRRSRAEHLPTAQWLFANKLRDILAYIFLAILLFLLLATWGITYALKRDCSDTYQRDNVILGYWIRVQAGKTQTGCPGPR